MSDSKQIHEYMHTKDFDLRAISLFDDKAFSTHDIVCGRASVKTHSPCIQSTMHITPELTASIRGDHN